MQPGLPRLRGVTGETLFSEWVLSVFDIEWNVSHGLLIYGLSHVELKTKKLREEDLYFTVFSLS